MSTQNPPDLFKDVDKRFWETVNWEKGLYFSNNSVNINNEENPKLGNTDGSPDNKI